MDQQSITPLNRHRKIRLVLGFSLALLMLFGIGHLFKTATAEILQSSQSSRSIEDRVYREGWSQSTRQYASLSFYSPIHDILIINLSDHPNAKKLGTELVDELKQLSDIENVSLTNQAPDLHQGENLEFQPDAFLVINSFRRVPNKLAPKDGNLDIAMFYFGTQPDFRNVYFSSESLPVHLFSNQTRMVIGHKGVLSPNDNRSLLKFEAQELTQRFAEILRIDEDKPRIPESVLQSLEGDFTPPPSFDDIPVTSLKLITSTATTLRSNITVWKFAQPDNLEEFCPKLLEYFSQNGWECRESSCDHGPIDHFSAHRDGRETVEIYPIEHGMESDLSYNPMEDYSSDWVILYESAIDSNRISTALKAHLNVFTQPEQCDFALRLLEKRDPELYEIFKDRKAQLSAESERIEDIQTE